MKKQGSVIEFLPQRDAELLAAFKNIVANSSTAMSVSDLMQQAAESPATRFWVSELRASEVIAKMFAGDPLEHMLPKRREMYESLFRLAREYRDLNPEASYYEMAYHAVNSPAPEFFLSPASARVILYKYRRRLREEKRHRC